jgi:hypothetical protein
MENDEINANTYGKKATLTVDANNEKPTKYEESEQRHHSPPKRQEDNYDPNYANNEGQSV